LNDFEAEGREVVKNWYTLAWDEDVEWLINDVRSNLEGVVRKYVKALDARLAEED
jgi:hypothetical protein